MTTTKPLDPAYQALDEAEVALEKLEAGCCQPLRSPRMAALAETLAAARTDLEKVDGHHSSAADELLAKLEDAGSQIGSLQIGCCAPARMPLYADMLVNLTKVQRSVNRALGNKHH